MELTGKWCTSDLWGSIADSGISLAVEIRKICYPCCDETTSFNSKTGIVCPEHTVLHKVSCLLSYPVFTQSQLRTARDIFINVFV